LAFFWTFNNFKHNEPVNKIIWLYFLFRKIVFLKLKNMPSMIKRLGNIHPDHLPVYVEITWNKLANIIKKYYEVFSCTNLTLLMSNVQEIRLIRV
jgi:hypothetical protein